MHYLNDLKRIININSYTKNKAGVDKVGLVFDEWLSALGYKVEIHERELIGEHRHYRSSQVKGKKLLLLGHLDTVFPPDKFEDYSEDEEWVYGPGVCDMKGGNLIAIEALRNLQRAGIPINNIDLLFVSDEETGSDDSKHLSSKLAQEYDYCLVYEAAGADMEVVRARKGVGTFTIDITGKAAHAGNHYADGNDANLEASYKLQKLVALSDLEKGTTVNVGKMDGGIGANTISPQAHLLFEIRYTQVQEKERLLSAIKTITSTSYVEGTSAHLGGGIQRDVMQFSENTAGFIKDIERIAKIKLSSQARGGVSDANILSAAGVITLDGFGPFGDGDHTIHERANKKSFDERIELSTILLKYFTQNLNFKG